MDDQFDAWLSDWDKARQTKDFQAKEQPIPDEELGSGFGFGLVSSNGGGGPRDAQDDYWNYLAGGEELLQEDETPNPVYPDSVGKDQDKPKAAWVDNNVIEEIQNLKKKLYELEVKLNANDAGGKKWAEKAQLLEPFSKETGKFQQQLAEMKKKIDELSNSLGTESEPSVSQWRTSK